MFMQMLGDSPQNRRGGGQVSHLLLAPGQFGSRNLAVTWVEGTPGSQQPLHAHQECEQVYVVVAGRGRMIVGGEEQDVQPGTLVFVPPGFPGTAPMGSSTPTGGASTPTCGPTSAEPPRCGPEWDLQPSNGPSASSATTCSPADGHAATRASPGSTRWTSVPGCSPPDHPGGRQRREIR